MNTSAQSKSIWQQDKDHFLHPWTVFDSFRDEGSLIINKGEGAYVYDVDGKRYLDGVGGLWCTNIGLGREEMATHIGEQVTRLAYSNAFVDMTNPPAAELAAKLAQLAPGNINHVLYTASGSASVDAAYRLIQFYQNCRGKHQKKHIISRDHAYHGSTFIAASICGTHDRPKEFDYVTDTMHHVSTPNFYRAPEHMDEGQYLTFLLDEFEAKIKEVGPDKVAAFFAEPVLGSGGVVVPPAGYHKGTWELCQRYDILYVSDEVVTAFGRLGHWFCSRDVFDLQPDIIITAKGLTSGYLPLGAALFSDEIYAVISNGEEGRCFAQGFTYSGHPVCCAAALKNIEIMERENLLQHVRDTSPYFREQLETLYDSPIVGDVRGSHFMMCVENVIDKDSKKPFPEEVNISKRISNACEDLGLLVRPVGNLNILSPPLVLDRGQIDFIVDTLREAQERVAVDLQIS